MPKNTSGLRRGGPGRPKGVPNKANQEIQAFAREFLADPQGVEAYRQQYREGKLAPAIWQTLMHYGYGKPKDVIEINQPAALAIPVLYTREDIEAVKDDDLVDVVDGDDD